MVLQVLSGNLFEYNVLSIYLSIYDFLSIFIWKGNLMVLRVLSGNPFEYNVLSNYATTTLLLRYYYATTMLLLCYYYATG